jgi:hypothetical protein
MLMRTPDASAETHSMIGTKLKNTDSTMMTTAANTKKVTNVASKVL